MINHANLTEVQAAAQIAVQAAQKVAVITAIQHWGGGAHNSGYQVGLEDGSRFFLKIEKENIFPRTRRCQIEREVYGISLAAKAGLDVPVIAGYDFTGQTCGCRYLLEEFVDRELLGDVIQSLPQEQRIRLQDEFRQVSDRLYAIQTQVFGELHPDGWLGQFDTWRAALVAQSAVMLEDTAALAIYSPSEMRAIQDAHSFALDQISFSGPPILTHNDLHEWNIFVEPGGDGYPHPGKIFDFGLSMASAAYLSCSGQSGFNGKEAEVALRFGVRESELHACCLVGGLEFVNFSNAIHFAPDRPYGCQARRREYLSACQKYLANC